MSNPGIITTALVGVLGLLLQAGTPAPVAAQVPEAPDTLLVLPPLERVISRVLETDPTIAESKAQVEQDEALLTQTSREWLKGLSLGVQTTAGTYGNDTVDELNTGFTSGVGLRLSFYDLFARGPRKQAYESELQMSQHRIERARMEATQYVVRMYRLIENAQAQAVVKADFWRAAQIHLKMAELEFSNGNLVVSELARVSEMEAKAEADYVNAVSEFRSWYDQLGIRIGIPLSSLR